jgi:dihydrofolate reductase
VHGSGNLVQTLLKQDLVDVFSLLVFPLVLGSGERLFGDGATPAGFKLADVNTSGSGVIAVRYERAAGVAYGSFAVEEATVVRKRQAQEG